MLKPNFNIVTMTKKIIILLQCNKTILFTILFALQTILFTMLK